ncbi:MAG: hypothetical protein QOH96_3626 [Blastocatellia bacterium]|nr:hypothetical protein [Blastocatellia bacterium]
MITGFNTDIEVEGTVYHVQTEDKGIDSPLILTLVYSGGAILASKRVLYDDLLEQGFDETVLIERLGRQHRLICAAVKAGRLEELKEMSRRDADARAAQTVQPPPKSIPSPNLPSPPKPEPTSELASERVPLPESVDLLVDPAEELESAPLPSETKQSSMSPSPVRVMRSSKSEGGYAGVFDKINLTGEEFSHDKSSLEILNERPFKAGESVTLDIAVRGSFDLGSKILTNIPVGVKILGTSFRPMILSSKTDKEGIASIAVVLPHFTSGRAAILIRAAVDGETIELRRMIHHA